MTIKTTGMKLILNMLIKSGYSDNDIHKILPGTETYYASLKALRKGIENTVNEKVNYLVEKCWLLKTETLQTEETHETYFRV